MNLGKDAIKRGAKAVFGAVGLRVTGTGPKPFVEFRDYIPCAQTIAAARRAGVGVGDYIDRTYSRVGVTAETVERMRSSGVLQRARRICEIGPGSGRYLEHVQRICSPDRYEIYETAVEWRAYLGRTFPHLISHAADGRTLSGTASESIDLVHTHKVFCGLPTMVALSYLREMARVVTPGGAVVFDVPTDRSLADEEIDSWLSSHAAYGTYPAMLPRQYVIDLLGRRGLRLRTSFHVDLSPGTSECFVFVRQQASD
jgi:SAM-dependent methyltransferase